MSILKGSIDWGLKDTGCGVFSTQRGKNLSITLSICKSWQCKCAKKDNKICGQSIFSMSDRELQVKHLEMESISFRQHQG